VGYTKAELAKFGQAFDHIELELDRLFANVQHTQKKIPAKPKNVTKLIKKRPLYITNFHPKKGTINKIRCCVCETV
jgi:hypothetical protein